MTEKERESKLKKFYRDPKLVHKNSNLYNRHDILQELMPQDRLEDSKLRDAYEDILKYNELANEYNYMIDVYQGIK